MNHDRIDPTAADGELLSAYLAGDLDDAAAADLERRMADEPQLAVHLDALADALVALGGFDSAVPPAGFEQRLAARLAEAPPAVADLDAHRRRRAASTQWLRIGTVAAVLALGAVMAGNMLRTGPQVAMDAAEQGGTESGAMDSAALESGAGRPDAPVVLDTNAKVAGEEALRARYETVPEVQGLLGLPRDEAAELAVAFGEAIRDGSVQTLSGTSAAASAPDADGEDLTADEGGGGGSSTAEEPAEDAAQPPAAPAPEAAADDAETRAAGPGDACLAAITKDAQAPLVPVRVETLRYRGEPAIAYVLVTATPDSNTLDRTEVWVVRPSDCTTIVFQQY